MSGERTSRILYRLSLTEARALILTIWSSMSLVIGYDIIDPSIFRLDPDSMSIFPPGLTQALWIIAGLFGIGCVLVADHDRPGMALPLGFGALVAMPAQTAYSCWSLVATGGEHALRTAMLLTGITIIVGVSAAVTWPPRVRPPWKRSI